MCFKHCLLEVILWILFCCYFNNTNKSKVALGKIFASCNTCKIGITTDYSRQSPSIQPCFDNFQCNLGSMANIFLTALLMSLCQNIQISPLICLIFDKPTKSIIWLCHHRNLGFHNNFLVCNQSECTLATQYLSNFLLTIFVRDRFIIADDEKKSSRVHCHCLQNHQQVATVTENGLLLHGYDTKPLC